MLPMNSKIAKEGSVMTNSCKISCLFRMVAKLAAEEFHIAITRRSWQM